MNSLGLRVGGGNHRISAEQFVGGAHFFPLSLRERLNWEAAERFAFNLAEEWMYRRRYSPGRGRNGWDAAAGGGEGAAWAGREDRARGWEGGRWGVVAYSVLSSPRRIPLWKKCLYRSTQAYGATGPTAVNVWRGSPTDNNGPDKARAR
jgi:hypothetical protein